MPTIALDKQFTGHVSQSFGTIQIRVVVLKVDPERQDADAAESPGEVDAASEEVTPSPLAAYLERKKHGRQCVVFLVGGQRHDTLDSTFVSADLEFKYLRNRTMIIVDLDGLASEAITEIVQGSRQGLYQGHVTDAIKDRLVGTLRKDPDLIRLQEAEEQRIAELQAGDEVVRQKLDELIDAHHSAATHTQRGAYEAGQQPSEETRELSGQRGQDIVIHGRHDQGDPATLPVLATSPSTMSIRLHPSVERAVTIESIPTSAWSDIEALDVRLEPPVKELTSTVTRTETHAGLELEFAEPAGFDTEEYPIESTLRVSAKFKGYSEVRVLERAIVVAPKRIVRKPPPAVLLSDPTFLRVVSRQPVKLVSGGAATHVRLCWDGDDQLTSGTGATWSFRSRCKTLETFPPIGSSQPKNGRFELLIDTPHGLLPGQTLEFDVEAIGPDGRTLAASFTGKVANPPPLPEPRRLHSDAPEPAAQRKPPYELKIVHKSDWNAPTCWGESAWTESDVGSYKEPTDSTPLTLIINDDAADLVGFRDALVKRRLDENTVRARVNNYTAHVGFHLYQMFRFKKERLAAVAADPTVTVPREEDERLEIRRVASTLLMLMEVSLRTSS